MNLKVVRCTPRYQLYYNAFLKSAACYHKDKSRRSLKQAVFLGVKYISLHRFKNKKIINIEEVQEYFNIIELIRCYISCLTPREFVNLFPINKDYDGDKYDCKDYFYTIEKLKEYDQNESIAENIDNFMWNYTNYLIGDFMVEMLCTASKLKRFQDGKGIMEEFAEQNGIGTYTVYEREGYIIDNQSGKTMPYHKPIPESWTVYS